MDVSDFNWGSSIKNRPRAELPKSNSIIEAFFLICQKFKHHDACIDELSGLWSYTKLKRFVIAISLVIKENKSNRIGILLPSSIFSMAVVLATLLANKIPVMINWSLGSRELQFVKEDANCKEIITSKSFIEKISYKIPKDMNLNVSYLEDIKLKFSLFKKFKVFVYSLFSTKLLLGFFGLKKINLEDIAVILFTSGTENRPKVVPLSHKNILSNQRGCLDFLQLEADNDIMLGYLPPFHTFGFTITSLLPLLTGFRVVYAANPLDGKKIVNFIHKYKITLLCTTPTLSYYLVHGAEDSKQLNSLRFVIFGGEAALSSHYLHMQSVATKASIIQGYGVTECSPVITISSPRDPQAIGVGKPILDTKLLIVHHETFEILPTGSVGLILVRGPGVFSGYLNSNIDPFYFYNGQPWYITGDLGKINEKGILILSGRLKRFVKIGGEMISLMAVESILTSYFHRNEIENSSTFVVCGLEGQNRKTQLCLFSTLPISLKEVNLALRESGLNNLVKISFLHCLDTIPLLGSGKPAYADLMKLAKKLFG